MYLIYFVLILFICYKLFKIVIKLILKYLIAYNNTINGPHNKYKHY